MKEKLIIKNFGPIKSVELELGRFNVLIGEQATGKSTVAKVLAVCRYFSYIIQNDSSEQPFESGLLSWGLGEGIMDNTYISYECNHYTFKIERILTTVIDQDQEDGSPYEYDFPIFLSSLEAKSEDFIALIAELDKIKPKPKPISETFFDFDSFEWKIPTSFFKNDVARVLDNPFYLPAERGLQSIFSLGKSSIQNISDSLFNQLAQMDQVARLYKNETLIEPLDIAYKNVDGRGYIKKKTDSKFFSLFNAATGYQSTIPVVLLTKYYSELRKKKKTFIIEEPELNLFPTAQGKLMQYLVDKTMNFGNSILLTTHSPYILTSLNNLIYAHETGKANGEETEKIISKKYWLNPDEVSVYMLLPNGECENIFDREEKLIKADKIDEISRRLNSEFDDLINLELGVTNE